MDLRLYGRVVWRFRIVVAIGLVLAILLATLSFVSVSFSKGLKVSYRQSEDWEATTMYVLSGEGFPVGSVYSAGTAKSPLALSGLATVYAQIAMSDAVRTRIQQTGPLHGIITAKSLVDTQTSQRANLPLLAIYADAATPSQALTLARRAANAFTGYVRDQQNKYSISPSNRVQFQVLSAPKQPLLVTPRKKTLPIVIFLTILTATLGLAFVLENLRPRVHPISTLEDERPRRSA